MADLVLTGQATSAGQIQTRITQLRNSMDLRKEIWDRLPLEKKRAWIPKDPVLALAWDEYVFLHKYFRGLDDGKL